MKTLFIIVCIISVLIFLVLLISFICFCMAFLKRKPKTNINQEYDLPPGKVYEPYHDMMIAWMKELKGYHYDKVSITSFDGLKLYGKYYEYKSGAPIELMFHGYRGNAERDLCGGVQRCFALGHSALIVDQRTSGESEGKVITFGVNESRDCLSWIDFMIKHFGKDVKIILSGVSMGAATVMMAAGRELPKNVISVLADCGYTSAKDIITKVIQEMGLPAKILYPFVKLGAKVFGRFELEENPPIESLKKCKVPVIFAHGETDDFVPCEMSVQNYNVCASPKRIITVPDAGHGLAFPANQEMYINELARCWAELGVE